MVKPEIIDNRLIKLQEYLEKLAELKKMKEDDFISDFRNRSSVKISFRSVLNAVWISPLTSSLPIRCEDPPIMLIPSGSSVKTASFPTL